MPHNGVSFYLNRNEIEIESSNVMTFDLFPYIEVIEY